MIDDLATFPGRVSVWCGPLSGEALQPCRSSATYFTHAEHDLHYAASTMKIGVMVAAFRRFTDLDQPVLVHNSHRSADPQAPAFGNDGEDDGDPEVWQRIGGHAPLRWLITRMIVRSSNLATNLVLGALDWDFAEVNRVWTDAGSTGAHTDRGIEDSAGRLLGVTNEVSAAALGLQMAALVAGRLAGPAQTDEMLDILCAQEFGDDFARGLPAGTRMACKNGWITGVRHSVAAVFPTDAAPFVLAACTTSDVPDEQACAMLADLARAAWDRRHD